MAEQTNSIYYGKWFRIYDLYLIFLSYFTISAGLVLPNGEINWACPCLGGMATGPCGVEFREAFTCFHHSKADPKGSDCLEIFRAMSTCMSYFPGVYGSRDDEEKTKDSLNNDNSNSQNETGSNSHNLSRIAKSNS